MEAKQSSLNDFEVLSKLGEGAFGQVYRVVRKADKKEYALKKVKIGAMKEKQRQNALNEIRILASYNEEFIIGYKEAFYQESTQTLCVVMEFAAGGDILKKNQTHLKQRTKYAEAEIWKALVHMTKGLKSLHDRKILHRDLKCANVFITADGLYKLGDLNVSKVLKKDLASTQTGTPYYASPEVWKDKPYGVKSDIWSLGCVLYEMAALKPPFMANDLQGLYKKVIAGVFERIPMNYSNDLASTIASLLKIDPNLRPDCDKILSLPAVLKNCSGATADAVKDGDEIEDELLKTIKYNPKDLRGIKNVLPKSNYDSEQKIDVGDDARGLVQSAKSTRKQPTIEASPKPSPIPPIQGPLINANKLSEYLEKKNVLEQRERQRQLKIPLEQKNEVQAKRERVLSACGIRQPAIYDSPKIAVHKRDDDSLSKLVNSAKPTHKEVTPNSNSKNFPPKLPPKPMNQPPNYRLPPRPEPQSNGTNRSIQIEPTRSREDASNSREKSRQDIRNVGERIVGSVALSPSSRVNRSSSANKIVYPSWWGG